MSFSVEAVPLWVILPLRQQVLRPLLPTDAARFDGDDDPTTIHLAIRAGQDVIGVTSLYRRPCPDRDADAAMQLRGMAVAPKNRGRGVGSALLDSSVRHARAVGVTVLWCNARVEAVGFYLRHGWRTLGREFDIPGVGPHHRMFLLVSMGETPSE